jgi:hypothetical protein
MECKKCKICGGTYPAEKHKHSDKCHSQMSAVTNIHDWESKFENNDNTGNKYEKVAGAEILRLSGLDGTDALLV